MAIHVPEPGLTSFPLPLGALNESSIRVFPSLPRCPLGRPSVLVSSSWSLRVGSFVGLHALAQGYFRVLFCLFVLARVSRAKGIS